MPKPLTSDVLGQRATDTKRAGARHSGTLIPPSSRNPAALWAWEQAEIKRSAAEAALTDSSDLRTSDANIARYMAPPADTVFPLEYAFHLLRDVRGRDVLEYGCGSGENTLMLAHRGALVRAIDISLDLIMIANRRMQVNGITDGIRFQVASAYDLPYPDESVDVVFGMFILHHLDLEQAAREVYRVLRKGGRAIFSEPMRSSKMLRALRKLIPYRAPDVSPFERPLMLPEIEEFSRAFEHGRTRSFDLPWARVAAHLPVLRHKLMLLHRWDAALMASYPWLEYYAAVRVFELHKR